MKFEPDETTVGLTVCFLTFFVNFIIPFEVLALMKEQSFNLGIIFFIVNATIYIICITVIFVYIKKIQNGRHQ